ncbi:MAG TPA: glycosyltransferase family 4 protein [Pyrinomonadaceae bacterium]|jgi:glycosyltransferase involved in cell wall biosynthesis
MRIAILTRNRSQAGGVEIYLNDLIPELLRRNHSIAFIHEEDMQIDREPIALPREVPVWSVKEMGSERSLSALREWQPDLIYSHSFHDPNLEAEALEIAPAVFFAHVYHGTCVSGTKTCKSGQATPCRRRFGWQCLLHYYPQHCGGWNPLTMLRQYDLQSHRLSLLRSYRAIMTSSDYMREEYLRHGFSPERIFKAPLFAHQTETETSQPEVLDLEQPAVSGNGNKQGQTMSPRRLLFLGRMERLKGGTLLLEALRQVSETLERPLRLTLAGEGSDRESWEREAARVQAANRDIQINFLNWVDRARHGKLFAETDLLIVPSIWPEPFGMVGPEAGLRGVPAAAFAVGGIPDWLTDGVNGHLAPGDPPTSAGLAHAIIKCLDDPSHYDSLRHGAFEMAQRFSLKNHLAVLLKVFEEVAHHEAGAVTSPGPHWQSRS